MSVHCTFFMKSSAAKLSIISNNSQKEIKEIGFKFKVLFSVEEKHKLKTKLYRVSKVVEKL